MVIKLISQKENLFLATLRVWRRLVKIYIWFLKLVSSSMI